MGESAETIVAVATPPGRGGIGVVRVSGPLARTIAAAVLGSEPAPRQALHARFLDRDGATLDDGIALFFASPSSFTGEDVLELQGHGGPVVLDLLVQRCLALGARLARPGEFSERAFLNDKLDLAQAEAIADLIDSATEQGARAALRSLQGEFSARVDELLEHLIEARTHLEAAIDFPEEEIDFLSDPVLAQRLTSLQENHRALMQSARRGCLLRDGLNLVIAGRPNAGKSSLLNALASREAAIVTDIPGTTRDVLREQINLDGIPLHVFDTAGLRVAQDPVEQIGVDRAWETIGTADHVLLVVDDRSGPGAEDQAIIQRLPAELPRTLVRNKIDLSETPPGLCAGPLATEVRVSALTGSGLDLLRSHLKTCAGYEGAGEGDFMARRRHLDALTRCGAHLAAAREQLQDGAGELSAEELRLAQRALGEITGEFSSDDLLGRIFSSFCIGK